MTTPPTPATRRRRRIGWFLPLVATPVVFFTGMLVAGMLELSGAPEILWRVPWVLGFVGAGASLVFSLIGIVRALSPHAGRLSPEEQTEYDEYVRLNGGEEPPIPTGRLLALAIVLTIASVGVIALRLAPMLGLTTEPVIERGSSSSWVWPLIVVGATPVIWGQYAVLRRAQLRYRARQQERNASWPGGSGAVVRRHRTWVLPLLAIPAIILVAVLIILGLRSVDAPREAIRSVSVTMFVGIAVALVVLVVAIVRFLRLPPAPRAPRAPGFYDRLSSSDARRRGLTPEEYGVYKGNVGSLVEPVNSAGGLLVIAILMTVMNVFLLVLVGVMIAQANGLIPRNPDDEGLSPVQWGFFVFQFLFVPVAWRYYLVERRAQKLRAARGLPETLR